MEPDFWRMGAKGVCHVRPKDPILFFLSRNPNDLKLCSFSIALAPFTSHTSHPSPTGETLAMLPLSTRSRIPGSAPWGIALLAGSWLVAESAFYLAFHLYLVPRANRRTSPRPFRSPVDRRQYLVRMVQRLLGDNDIHSIDDEQAKKLFARYLMAWFSKKKEHGATSVENDVAVQPDGTWMVPGLTRESMVKLYAWAFFTKEVPDLTEQECVELDELVTFLTDTLHQRFDDDSQSGAYEPRRISLENVEVMHRPLAIYGASSLLQCTAGVLLRLAGFSRICSRSTGLTGWYRPGVEQQGESAYLPVAFFHGIAPAGLSFYLPMLRSVVPQQAPCFLFDNPNIACSIQFSALNEEETARGVQEMIDQYCGADTPFIVAGHSFGSCPISWLLLNDKLASRIQKAVLLEPVTILLHGTCFLCSRMV